MKKALPYLYIIIGGFILAGTFLEFFQEKETYRLLFNFKTENKYIFALVRGLFSAWFIVDGVKKIQQRNSNS